MSPDAALAVCRFTHDAAAMLVWGAAAYLAALVPRDLATHAAQRVGGILGAVKVLAIVTAFASLPPLVASVGDGWPDAINPATVRAVLFETSVGRAWLVQAAAAMLLAATIALSQSRRLAGTAAASGLMLASLALTGHAAMHEGWLGVAHRLIDALHVLAAGAWFGALVPLLPILAMLDDPARRRAAGIALRRFSSAGHGAVALATATGAANTWLVLGRWPTNWTSPYQALLAAKIALALAMTALALSNRYWVVPRMKASLLPGVRLLRWGTASEIGLGLAALACVSVFGLLEPV